MHAWEPRLVLVFALAACGAFLSVSCATSREESLASNGGSSGVDDGGADGSVEDDAHQIPDGTWPEGQVSPEGGTGGFGGTGGTGTGGSGTGGTGTAGTGGSGGCTPQCAARECGPDQCGSTCPPGCSASQQCTAQGTCQDVCSDTWIVPVADSIYGVAVQPAGDVYAVGSEGNHAWVGALSTCNGSTKASRTVSVPGSTSTSGIAVTLSGNDVYVTGVTVPASDPQNGMWARLSAGSLTLAWANPLYGSTGIDELWGIAAPSNGSIWMAGASAVDTAATFWGIKGQNMGGACGFPVFSAGGAGRNVVASGADVYMVGARGAAAGIARFDASGCSTSGPCPCDPVWQSQDLQVGAAVSEARGIAIAGSSIYVAGFAVDDAASIDYKAFVARVDINSGAIIAAWTWNPTSQFDALTDIATDGQRLYASGMTGWDGSASFGSGTAVVLALPFDFASSTPTQWYAELPSVDVAYRIALDTSAPGAVYLGGLGTTSGYVIRCTRTGACP